MNLVFCLCRCLESMDGRPIAVGFMWITDIVHASAWIENVNGSNETTRNTWNSQFAFGWCGRVGHIVHYTRYALHDTLSLLYLCNAPLNDGYTYFISWFIASTSIFIEVGVGRPNGYWRRNCHFWKRILRRSEFIFAFSLARSSLSLSLSHSFLYILRRSFVCCYCSLDSNQCVYQFDGRWCRGEKKLGKKRRRQNEKRKKANRVGDRFGTILILHGFGRVCALVVCS